jgi:tetratricopeptide (TPR) repeat protein
MTPRRRRALLLALLAALAVAHAVYFHYDSRAILDHDDFYLRGFAAGDAIPPYPLVNGLLAAAYTVLPATPAWMAVVSFLFFALLVTGAHALARELGEDDEAALVAALVVAALPLIDNHSRKFFLQHYSAAWLLWAAAFAVRWWREGDRRAAAGLAAAGLAAHLTHPLALLQSAPIFVLAAAAPYFDAAADAVTKKRRSRAMVLVWLAIVAAGLLAANLSGELVSTQDRVFENGAAEASSAAAIATDAVGSFVRFWGLTTALVVAGLWAALGFALRRKASPALRAVTLVAVAEVALAIALHTRHLELMGFSLAYALPPLLAVVALGQWRAGDAAAWARPAFTAVIALLLLAAVGTKAGVFWCEGTLLNGPSNATDRRTIVAMPEVSGGIVAALGAAAGGGPVALDARRLIANEDGALVRDPEMASHATSALRLLARTVGVRLSQPERDPFCPYRAEVLFFAGEDLAAFAAFALPHLRADERWRIDAAPPAAAESLSQDNRPVAVLWRVRPYRLTPEAFRELRWPDPSGRVESFFAEHEPGQLERLAAEATKAGQPVKAAAVLTYLVRTAGAAYRVPLVEAALRANDPETALAVWREVARDTDDFGAALNAVRRVAVLEVAGDLKTAVVEPLNTLDRASFIDPNHPRTAIEDALFFESADVGDVRATIEPLLQSGQTDRADRVAQYVLTINPDDVDMLTLRLARALAEGDRDAATELETRIFGSEDFGVRLRVLRRLAERGVDVPAIAEVFARRLAAERTNQQADRQNTYMLASLAVYERKAHEDWDGALAALARLRPLLKPAQVPGVDVEEAAVRHRLGQGVRALAMLEKTMQRLPASDPVRGDAAQLAARLFAEQGQIDRAAEALGIAGALTPGEDAFAGQVAELAREVAANDPAAAARLLETMTATAQGNARGLLWVEQAKLSMAAGENAAARTQLDAALEALTDPVVQKWTRETLADLPN